MAEDGQANVASVMKMSQGDGLEGQAGRIMLALVVARDDDAGALVLDGDLGGAEHMAGRMEVTLPHRH